MPESGAKPEGFCNFRTADPIIIIHFDLPAGCQKHFVACHRVNPFQTIGYSSI
jgi:hypothetical protein